MGQTQHLYTPASTSPCSSSRGESQACGGASHGPGSTNNVLRTCSVRPPGIWGPGEQRHFPRILQHARCACPVVPIYQRGGKPKGTLCRQKTKTARRSRYNLRPDACRMQCRHQFAILPGDGQETNWFESVSRRQQAAVKAVQMYVLSLFLCRSGLLRFAFGCPINAKSDW